MVSGKRSDLDDVEKEQIDANLRRIFDDAAEEELPDDLKSLLDRLEEIEGSGDQEAGQ